MIGKLRTYNVCIYMYVCMYVCMYVHVRMYLMALTQQFTGIADEGEVFQGHSLCNPLHQPAQLLSKHLKNMLL